MASRTAKGSDEGSCKGTLICQPRSKVQKCSSKDSSLSSYKNSITSSVKLPPLTEYKTGNCNHVEELNRVSFNEESTMVNQKTHMTFPFLPNVPYAQRSLSEQYAMESNLPIHNCYRFSGLKQNHYQQLEQRMNRLRATEFLNSQFLVQENLTNYCDEDNLLGSSRLRHLTSQDLNATFFTGRFTSLHHESESGQKRNLFHPNNYIQTRNNKIAKIDVGPSARFVSRSSSSLTHHQPEDDSILCTTYAEFAATATRNLSNQWLNCDYANNGHHQNSTISPLFLKPGDADMNQYGVFGGDPCEHIQGGDASTLTENKNQSLNMLVTAKTKKASRSSKMMVSAQNPANKKLNGGDAKSGTSKDTTTAKIETEGARLVEVKKVVCQKEYNVVKSDGKNEPQKNKKGKKKAVYGCSTQKTHSVSQKTSCAGKKRIKHKRKKNLSTVKVLKTRTRPTFRELRRQSMMETLEQIKSARAKLDSIQLSKIQALEGLNANQVLEAASLIILPPFPASWPKDHLTKYDRVITGDEASKIVTSSKSNGTTNSVKKVDSSQPNCRADEALQKDDETEPEEEELVRCNNAFVDQEKKFPSNVSGSSKAGMNVVETSAVCKSSHEHCTYNTKGSNRAVTVVSPIPYSLKSYYDKCNGNQHRQPCDNDDHTITPIIETTSLSEKKIASSISEEALRSEQRPQTLTGQLAEFRLQVVSPETTMNKVNI